MNQIATQHQLECLELAKLNARVDQRIMEQRKRQAEKMAADEAKKERAELQRKAAEAHLVAHGTAVTGCIIAAVTCVCAAPWWTAVAPMALAWAVLRKAGW